LFYSTEETWKRGVGWAFPWLSEAVDLRMLNGCVAANAPVRPLDGLGIGLKVTPVPVYHGDLADQPVIYVVEFGSGETCVKIVLAWDLLHLVTRHPEPAGVEPAPGWGPEVCSDRPACPAGIVRLLGR